MIRLRGFPVSLWSAFTASRSRRQRNTAGLMKRDLDQARNSGTVRVRRAAADDRRGDVVGRCLMVAVNRFSVHSVRSFRSLMKIRLPENTASAQVSDSATLYFFTT